MQFVEYKYIWTSNRLFEVMDRHRPYFPTIPAFLVLLVCNQNKKKHNLKHLSLKIEVSNAKCINLYKWFKIVESETSKHQPRSQKYMVIKNHL
jgi:hypothetical protein